MRKGVCTMHVICPISGLTTPYREFTNLMPEVPQKHPVYSLNNKELSKLVLSWLEENLASDEEYLLFTALLVSSKRLVFRESGFIKTANTDGIISANMTKLVSCMEKVWPIASKNKFNLPEYVIDSSTAGMEDIGEWITVMEDAVSGYQLSYEEEQQRALIENDEYSLRNLITKKMHNKAVFSRTLANWAAKAGYFPEHLIQPEGYSNSVSCADYWKAIIERCSNHDQISKISKADLDRLIEYCEDYIDHGTLFSVELMKHLRAGAEVLRKKDSYYIIVDSPTAHSPKLSVERIVIDMDALPSKSSLAGTGIESVSCLVVETYAEGSNNKPSKEQFSSQLSWLRAKVQWNNSNPGNKIP